MKKVGFIGWRGMVGSVLMERMRQESDFLHISPIFFSTSQVGEPAPDFTTCHLHSLQDAFNLKILQTLDIIVTCQGGEYTRQVYPALRASGWQGYWIDASSALRMEKDAVVILDPVNQHIITQALKQGIKTFVGGNCTVSLMLMALGGLFEKDLIEWVAVSTYQAASGAGAKNMRELLLQMGDLESQVTQDLTNPASDILALEKRVAERMQSTNFPCSYFGVPLAGSLIPWIDTPMPNGQTKEEWKGMVETNKILGREDNPIAIDGNCVRIGALRCHSQSFTIKLKENLSLTEIESIIASHNEWVQIIPNNKVDTLNALSPANVTGTLRIPIGRLRKSALGEHYLSAFTVGDQLLWGAAEPVRRFLMQLIHHNNRL